MIDGGNTNTTTTLYQHYYSFNTFFANDRANCRVWDNGDVTLNYYDCPSLQTRS